MLKSSFLLCFLTVASLSNAQVINFMEVELDPSKAIFNTITKDKAHKVVVKIDQPIIPIYNNAIPLASREYSKVDGMPIIKPYVNTKDIPKYDPNPNGSIQKKDFKKYPGLNNNSDK